MIDDARRPTAADRLPGLIALRDDARGSGQVVLVYSARQLAVALGVSLRTVWRLAAAGKLPKPVRIGSGKRWRREEILAWIASGCPVRTHGP